MREMLSMCWTIGLEDLDTDWNGLKRHQQPPYTNTAKGECTNPGETCRAAENTLKQWVVVCRSPSYLKCVLLIRTKIKIDRGMLVGDESI